MGTETENIGNIMPNIVPDPTAATNQNIGRATPGGGVNPTINAGAAPNAPSQVPDFLSVAKRMAVATAISSDGSKYVKDLKTYLEEKNATTTKVVIKPLPYPTEALAVVAGANAVILLFSEALRKDDNLPSVAFSYQSVNALRTVLGTDIKVLNVIVVTPKDYSKPEIMGAYLINLFNAQSNGEVQALTINSIRGYNIELSTTPQAYQDFCNRYDPHGVPARAEETIVVYMNTAKNQRTSNPTLFQQAETERIEIGAIGAFVTFQRGSFINNVQRFIPEIHISNLVTCMPCDGVLALLLAIATHCLIDDQFWKSQFANFGRVSEPNLGNLINDDKTGAPWNIENIQARESFIAQCCEPPVLILDVTEGRCKIPGLERFAMAESKDQIIASMNRFLQGSGSALDPNIVPVTPWAKEYTGTVSVGGEAIDSTWVDFLNMMVHHSQDRARCEMLLSHPMRELDMVEAQRYFCPDLSLHYVRHMCILQAPMLRLLQQSIRSVIHNINGTATTGMLDTSVLLTSGKGFMNGNGLGGGYGFATSTPFNLLYGVNGIQGNLFK